MGESGASEPPIASFRQSIRETLAIAAGGVMLTVACALIAIGRIPVAPWSPALFAGYAGLPMFGIGTLLILARLFRPGPVVEVMSSGIRCRRWPQPFVPWSAIADITVGQVRRQRYLVFHIQPQAGQPARTRTISMSGLEGTLEDLLAAIGSARSGAARGTSTR
jgi:hypothetical protein